MLEIVAGIGVAFLSVGCFLFWTAHKHMNVGENKLRLGYLRVCFQRKTFVNKLTRYGIRAYALCRGWNLSL